MDPLPIEAVGCAQWASSRTRWEMLPHANPVLLRLGRVEQHSSKDPLLKMTVSVEMGIISKAERACSVRLVPSVRAATRAAWLPFLATGDPIPNQPHSSAARPPTETTFAWEGILGETTLWMGLLEAFAGRVTRASCVPSARRAMEKPMEYAQNAIPPMGVVLSLFCLPWLLFSLCSLV